MFIQELKTEKNIHFHNSAKTEKNIHLFSYLSSDTVFRENVKSWVYD